jgi:hypothetical protein
MMTAWKCLLLFGGILIGLFILMAAGMGLLVLLLDEAGEDGINIAELNYQLPFSFPLRGGLENEGNEFTGQTSGWLFGIACLPVIFSLIARLISRRVSLHPRLKGLLEWFTSMNKKYFMPFHTYLSILALVVATVHLLISSCPNPLPEWGLIIAGILVATGLIIKLRIASKVSPKLLKGIYQFHASLVVTGILISVLLAGHVFMD